jgi:hypothetical protein
MPNGVLVWWLESSQVAERDDPVSVRKHSCTVHKQTGVDYHVFLALQSPVMADGILHTPLDSVVDFLRPRRLVVSIAIDFAPLLPRAQSRTVPMVSDCCTGRSPDIGVETAVAGDRRRVCRSAVPQHSQHALKCPREVQYTHSHSSVALAVGISILISPLFSSNPARLPHIPLRKQSYRSCSIKERHTAVTLFGLSYRVLLSSLVAMNFKTSLCRLLAATVADFSSSAMIQCA